MPKAAGATARTLFAASRDLLSRPSDRATSALNDPLCVLCAFARTLIGVAGALASEAGSRRPRLDALAVLYQQGTGSIRQGGV